MARTTVARLTARVGSSSLRVPRGAVSSVSPSAVSGALCDSALFHLRCAWRARVAAGSASELATSHAEAAQRCLLLASELDGSNGSVQCLLMLRAAECGRVVEAQRWADTLAASRQSDAEQPTGLLSRLLVSRINHTLLPSTAACFCCCPCAASVERRSLLRCLSSGQSAVLSLPSDRSVAELVLAASVHSAQCDRTSALPIPPASGVMPPATRFALQLPATHTVAALASKQSQRNTHCARQPRLGPGSGAFA